MLREVAERADNPALAIDAGGFVAQGLEATGQHRSAEAVAARLRADADALGLVFARRWALYVSGTVALARDPVAARGWFDAGAATVPPGCQHNVARFLVRGQGVAAVLAGRLDEGAAYLLDALAQDEAVGDVHQQAITLMAIALLLAERGSCEAAAELAAAADPRAHGSTAGRDRVGHHSSRGDPDRRLPAGGPPCRGPGARRGDRPARRAGAGGVDDLAQLLDADQVARGIAEGAVADAVGLVGRLLDDLGVAGLQPLEGAVEVGVARLMLA